MAAVTQQSVSPHGSAHVVHDNRGTKHTLYSRRWPWLASLRCAASFWILCGPTLQLNHSHTDKTNCCWLLAAMVHAGHQASSNVFTFDQQASNNNLAALAQRQILSRPEVVCTRVCVCVCLPRCLYFQVSRSGLFRCVQVQLGQSCGFEHVKLRCLSQASYCETFVRCPIFFFFFAGGLIIICCLQNCTDCNGMITNSDLSCGRYVRLLLHRRPWLHWTVS